LLEVGVKTLTQDRFRLKSGMTKGVLLFILLSSIIWARGFGPDGLDSLDRLPPNLRYYYTQKNFPNETKEFQRTDSQGVRMIGKWGRGPSSRVTGRDSLVFLSLGSEVAIINMSNPSNPQIVYEVQARGGVAKSVVEDSFLFIGGPGIEIWNIRNPSSPVFRNRIETSVSDFCIKDTFLYAVAGDSFRIFNIANINNPYRNGICADAGYYLSVAGNYAYISDRWGLYIVNIQNPANPFHVNSWGSAILSAQARDTFCYVSTFDPMNPDWLRFTILNVSNPNSIQEVSHIDNAGGYDIYLLGYFAYISGYYLPVGEFQIIDISNSNFPNIVSRCTTAGWNNGVWVNNPFGNAFIADDWEGLKVININNPTNPYIDTSMMGAEYALDVCVDNNYAYIADRRSGLKIIDVINPTVPFQVGEYDTIGDRYDIYSAVALDSFAYVGAPIPYFKFGSIDVSIPSQPVLAGTTQLLSEAEDMIIRDSLVYIAGDYRFQIYNVARPRQPRLVGSCNIGNTTCGLCLKDSLVYVATTPGVRIINISNPANPVEINSINDLFTTSVSVKDTIAYLSNSYDSLKVWNVANINNPYQISSLYLGMNLAYYVVVDSNLAYVGSVRGLSIVDISNPQNMSIVGLYNTPDNIRRVFYLSPYIYCACFSGGMVILEKTASGIVEQGGDELVLQKQILYPNPTTGILRLEGVTDGVISIYDINGREVRKKVIIKGLPFNQKLDLSALPQGCYIIYIREAGLIKTSKFIIKK
jgi:hypothetical protein